MQPIYDFIGAGYNKTRTADPYIAQRISDLLRPEQGLKYVDIGCGTGNYTGWFAGMGYNFKGVDPSEMMLREARLKCPDVEWLQGSAENIPAPDKIFAGAIATLTIHHWEDLPNAFKELHRVLMPGARIVFFTSTPAQMKGYWLNHYFPKMLADSIAQMPSLDIITGAANDAGFNIALTEKYDIREDLQDMFLYVGKHNPQLYFEEYVREGISSFAALANRTEVEAGLKMLKADLATGDFSDIKRRYQNDDGDYLFMVMERI